MKKLMLGIVWWEIGKNCTKPIGSWKIKEDGLVFAWGAMSMNSIGFIHRIQRIMNRYVYIVKYSKKDTTIICRKMSGKWLNLSSK